MRKYYPDPAGKFTFEWVVRQFHRISDAINNQDNIKILVSTDSPYTLQDGDYIVFCDTAGGAITVNITGQDRRRIIIKNIATSGVNAVTVHPSDDIDRTGVDKTLAVMATLDIVYSKPEVNWFIM